MTTDVLAFIEDPGAANFILPVVAALKDRGIEIVLRSAGAATAFAGAQAVTAGESAVSLIATYAPRLVLVGTSENPATLGLALIDAGRARGLPTVSAVDSPANADSRFRGVTTHALAHAPSRVLVADEATAAAFVALGCSRAAVKVCGHPHFDTVRARAKALDIEGRAAVRKRVLAGAPGERRVIVFASEVSTGLNPGQYRRSAAYTLHGSGKYDLRTEIVLEEFLSAVDQEASYLVLRLHPKNTRDDLAPFLARFDEVSAGGSALDVVFAADAVAGMTSILLLEAALIGRPALAILPRPEEAAWLPGIAAGLVATATTPAELRAALPGLVDARRVAPALPPENAAARAAQIIAELLR
jgi:hypothetical protein